METNKETKIKGFIKKHKKYFILFGIYLLLCIVSAVYDPWDPHASYEIDGVTYYVPPPEYELYDDYRYFAPGWIGDENSAAGNAVVRLMTFGVADLTNLFTLPKNSRINEVLRIVFPTMMFLKAVIMKRFFEKKKDPVTLGNKKISLLYYRSESIIAELAADNIAFFLIGVTTRLIYAMILPLIGSTGSVLGDIFDLIYCIMLIPCFIPFVLTEYMVGRFHNALGELLLFYYDANKIRIFFLTLPMLSIGLLLGFEITLRFSSRLVTAVFGKLRQIFKYTIETFKKADKNTA